MTLMARIPDLILFVSGDDQLREEQLQNVTEMQTTASLNSVRRVLYFSGDLSRSHRSMVAWIFHIVCVFGVRMGYLSFEPVILKKIIYHLPFPPYETRQQVSLGCLSLLKPVKQKQG